MFNIGRFICCFLFLHFSVPAVCGESAAAPSRVSILTSFLLHDAFMKGRVLSGCDDLFESSSSSPRGDWGSKEFGSPGVPKSAATALQEYRQLLPKGERDRGRGQVSLQWEGQRADPDNKLLLRTAQVLARLNRDILTNHQRVITQAHEVHGEGVMPYLDSVEQVASKLDELGKSDPKRDYQTYSKYSLPLTAGIGLATAAGAALLPFPADWVSGGLFSANFILGVLALKPFDVSVDPNFIKQNNFIRSAIHESRVDEMAYYGRKVSLFPQHAENLKDGEFDLDQFIKTLGWTKSDRLGSARYFLIHHLFKKEGGYFEAQRKAWQKFPGEASGRAFYLNRIFYFDSGGVPHLVTFLRYIKPPVNPFRAKE